MQGRLQHRYPQKLERSDFKLQRTDRQRASQTQKGFVDIDLYLVLVFQGFEQQRPGEGVDVLER
nr:hypothetical protein [Pseudomonas sp. 58 R 3]